MNYITAAFAHENQIFSFDRDFALPYWSDPVEVDLSERYQTVTDYDGFDVGDCTFHHGWTLHRCIILSISIPLRKKDSHQSWLFYYDSHQQLHAFPWDLSLHHLQNCLWCFHLSSAVQSMRDDVFDTPLLSDVVYPIGSWEILHFSWRVKYY